MSKDNKHTQGSPGDFEDKIDLLEEKIENFFLLPLKLFPNSVDSIFNYDRKKIKFLY